MPKHCLQLCTHVPHGRLMAHRSHGAAGPFFVVTLGTWSSAGDLAYSLARSGGAACACVIPEYFTLR
eukprot:2792144-Prymnesium_polylepis.1